MCRFPSAWSLRGAAAILLLVVPVSTALAQGTSASDRETARNLMAEGDAQRDKRNYPAALESYRAADAIMHVPTTGLELARTQIQLGMLVEARDKLLDVTRIPTKSGEPPVFTEARATAQSLAAQLETRIAGLRVTLANAPTEAEVSVAVDGANVPRAALIAYRKLNPGGHVVVARMGTVERHESVALKEGEQREITLDMAAQPIVPAPQPASEPSASTNGLWKGLTIAGFGLAGAGVVAGTITGVLSIVDTNAAKNIPPSQGGCVGNACGPATHSDIDTARTMATISTAAFIAAGAGAALGVTSFFLARRSPAAEAAPKTGVYLSPTGGGVTGTF